MTVLEDDKVVSEVSPAARSAQRSRGVDLAAFAPLGLALAAVAFNLVVLRTELRTVAQLNDASVHVAMVRWAAQRINTGALVFDGWFPRLSLGVPMFHYYQSLPHVIAGTFATMFGAERTVAWTNYLLLSLWPLCIYWTVRLFGWGRWTAGTTALLAPLVSSVTGYGYEHASYVWGGNGIWSQLWGMWLFPPAIALSWRAVSRGKGYAVAALFVGLTIACHFLTGYLALLYLGLWAIMKPRNILRRLARSAAVGIGAVLVAAWILVPFLLDSKWASRSEYNVGTFWVDSYGGRKVIGWLLTGELFDHTRWPVLTVLVALGAIVCASRWRRDERARAILGFTLLGLLLFCGRDTIGFAIDLLPGGKDLVLHRFMIPVHLGGILLAGIGTSWLAQGVYARVCERRAAIPPIAIAAALVVFGLVVITPAWRQIARSDAQDAGWINQQRRFDATEGHDFTALAELAAARGDGRVYAGSAATNGAQIRVGSVPGFSHLLDDDVDAVGFTLRTLALTGDVETRFDDSSPAQLDLFNVRYLLTPTARPPTVPSTLEARRGRWSLWSVATSGYLRVVDTTAAITADRTNIGQRTAEFLRSEQPAKGTIPVIAFAGDTATMPTAPLGEPPGGPAGRVLVQYDRPDDGAFGGVVIANRPAVVMLKATYHPRWTATVDGKPVKTQTLAPSFVGVAVPAGRHRVQFEYRPFGYYWILFALGALTLVTLAVVPRYGPRALARARRRRERSGAPEHRQVAG